MEINYYQILGVSPRAEFAELKRAYYRCAKRCHPDLFGNSAEKTREFQLLVRAGCAWFRAAKRRAYDASLAAAEEHGEEAPPAPRIVPEEPLMDSEADDILEELMVGNDPSRIVSLYTLLSDLQKTEIFLRYREGRDHLYHRRPVEAERCFADVVDRAPENIVFRIYFARSLVLNRKVGRALRHYRAALRIGRSRVPEQRMLRIRREFRDVCDRHHPVLGFLRRLFRAPESDPFEDDADAMIAAVNRRIAAYERISRESSAGTATSVRRIRGPRENE